MNDKENIEGLTQGPHEKTSEEKARRSPGEIVKDVALFFASPFIAIAYGMALPFVGFYQFTKMSHEARVRRQANGRKKES